MNRVQMPQFYKLIASIFLYNKLPVQYIHVNVLWCKICEENFYKIV